MFKILVMLIIPQFVCGVLPGLTKLHLEYSAACDPGYGIVCKVGDGDSVANVCCDTASNCRVSMNESCSALETEACSLAPSAIVACGSGDYTYLDTNTCDAGYDLYCVAGHFDQQGSGSVCCEHNGGSDGCEVVAIGTNCTETQWHVCDIE